MKNEGFFSHELLELDSYPGAIVRLAGPIQSAAAKDGDVWLKFNMQSLPSMIRENITLAEIIDEIAFLRIRAYGNSVVRVTMHNSMNDSLPESEMLDFAPAMHPEDLMVEITAGGWIIRDKAGIRRAEVNNAAGPFDYWDGKTENWHVKPINLIIYPDGKIPVPFCSEDRFHNGIFDSFPLGRVMYEGKIKKTTFALSTFHNEHFAGSGERFNVLDLRGQTLIINNLDALGCNSRRAYKNVPFYLSSRNYGIFVHGQTTMRWSFGGTSTRSISVAVDGQQLDLFFIGGGSPEQVLFHYRQITGFPPELPLWSYGIWLSRMSYFSAEEVQTIANRLRKEDFPCDVLHLDTGYFAKDWICEWKFNLDRFPDPPGFMKKMLEQGFRITLWQTPYISPQSCRFEEGEKRNALCKPSGKSEVTGSDLINSGVRHIDFSSEDGREWYRNQLIKPLLEMGAAAIKADFGEELSPGEYAIPTEQLHNIYSLLYQKTAFELTQEVTGQGIIWARAGWAGCQRYPIHWGGDAECSFDGMAGSLRGGLQLGMSGFAFWSCDVPGFHGREDFMHSRPSDKLYVRWTQMAVFNSHIRYHGTTPREPYEYPAVADIVRSYWKLRYLLLPYLQQCVKNSIAGGMPVMRALLLAFPDDDICWKIDDQFMFGDDFLIAPLFDDSGTRNIYLPPGKWVDFWTGEIYDGSQWLYGQHFELEQLGILVRLGAKVCIYPEKISSTNDFDQKKITELEFGTEYSGVKNSIISKVTGIK